MCLREACVSGRKTSASRDSGKQMEPRSPRTFWHCSTKLFYFTGFYHHPPMNVPCGSTINLFGWFHDNGCWLESYSELLKTNVNATSDLHKIQDPNCCTEICVGLGWHLQSWEGTFWGRKLSNCFQVFQEACFSSPGSVLLFTRKWASLHMNMLKGMLTMMTTPSHPAAIKALSQDGVDTVDRG